MKRVFIILILMFGIIGKASANYSKLAYDFEFNGIDGSEINLSNYKNKVLVIVNVASRCGYTPQYEDLQTLWSNYKNKNLGGSTKTKDNALDSSIKRLTVMINKDQENDCDSSSQWTRDNMIKLTSACNNYISTLKKLQEGATTKEHQEKRKSA